MNKIFVILFILLFSTCYTLAQNTSSVDQTGNYHVATVNQTGSNTSDIDQIRTDYTYYPNVHNVATVNQNGSGNQSTIYQYKGTYGGNVYNSEATVQQVGSSNISDINQNVNDHAHSVTTQLGNQNQAYVDQISNTSWSTIYQNGHRNIGDQYLWTSNSTADITQVGNDNEAYQTTLTPPVKNSTFDVLQYGNGNYAQQDMKATAWGYASELNTEYVYQQGNYNTAYQYQEGSSNYAYANAVGNHNYADVTQIGDFTSSTQVQNGNYHSSTVSQIGDNNISTVTQY